MPNFKKMNIRSIRKYPNGISNCNNLLVHGNNLHVLNSLSDSFLGKIKCIYIDPPYNNGERYNHYHDDRDHIIWLNEITEILKQLQYFMSADGSLWISIDESEMHYLKVAADSVLGRNNFITTIIWQQRSTRENRNVFSNNHEYILVYARNPPVFKKTRNTLPLSKDVFLRYKNPDNDPRGPWQSISANVQAGHATKSQFYKINGPNGSIHSPPNGRCWVYNKNRMICEIKDNNIWFGFNGKGVPRIKKFLSQSASGVTPDTLWLADAVGTNKIAKKHLLSLFPNNTVFDTPKPEQLIKRVLEIATNEGDLVLDAYLGSGTTTAVAHKMNRRYIGVEVEKPAFEYAVQRMKRVVKGECGGISRCISWLGGGGFHYCRHMDV